MSYWKSKVVPKFKKLFDKGKKKGVSEVSKKFESSKASLDKEIEEKSSDLNPKVVEIYRSSSTFIAKKLLKEPNEATVKDNPDAAQGVLQELAKSEFPGAQVISDAGKKYGPALLPGPVVYLFQKASVFLVEEHLPEEPKAETRELSAEDVKPPVEEVPAETSAEAATAKDHPPPPAPPAAIDEKKKEEDATAVPPAVASEAVGDTPPPPAEKTD